jgi:hypothetical protein
MDTSDQEPSGMQALIEQTDEEVVNFAKFWQEASLNQRIELQSALFPEGLHDGEQTSFLNRVTPSFLKRIHQCSRVS